MLNIGPNDWKPIAGFLPVSLFTSVVHPESSREIACLVRVSTCSSLCWSALTWQCGVVKQNRSEHQCQHRWFKVLDPDLVKGPWTKEEDEKVQEFTKESFKP